MCSRFPFCSSGNRIPNAPLTKLYLPTGKKIKYEYDSLNRLKEKGIVTDTSEYYSELYTYEEGGYHEESVTGVFCDPSATTIKPDRETTFVSEDKYEYDLHGNISKRVTGGKECGVHGEIVMMWDGHSEDRDVLASRVDRGYTDFSREHQLKEAEKVDYEL